MLILSKVSFVNGTKIRDVSKLIPGNYLCKIRDTFKDARTPVTIYVPNQE